MRARRSCSQTDVRSAPNRRFAPVQKASSPAVSVVFETSREKVCSSVFSWFCRSNSPAARAASSAITKACPTEAVSLSFSADGVVLQPTTSTPIDSCTRTSGIKTAARVPRNSEPLRKATETSSMNCGVPPSNRPSGTIRPGQGSSGRRSTPDADVACKRVAAAVELEQNRAAAVDGRNSVLVKNRKQVAEPVGGRQRLEQAGLA